MHDREIKKKILKATVNQGCAAYALLIGVVSFIDQHSPNLRNDKTHMFALFDKLLAAESALFVDEVIYALYLAIDLIFNSKVLADAIGVGEVFGEAFAEVFTTACELLANLKLLECEEVPLEQLPPHIAFKAGITYGRA
jgi:hypothetical protein